MFIFVLISGVLASCTMECPIEKVTITQLGDGHCDIYCQNERCNWDKGDCFCGADGCDETMVFLTQIGNGHCDPECLSNNCRFDGGDCTVGTDYTCLYYKDDIWCDSKCNDAVYDWAGEPVIVLNHADGTG